jgi:cytochrome c-L
MQHVRFIAIILAFAALAACGKDENGSAAGVGEKSASASGECKLVSIKDNSPLAIKVVTTDTPEAKQFLETCVNPYTKIYAADAEAAKAGRKVYTFNNCMGCHGGKLEGIMAPSLSKNTQGGQGAFDQKWVYAQNLTDKGMFETIAAGTPGTSGGTMFVWHNQLPGHTGDGLSTDDILKVVAYIRTEYKGDGEKTWLSEK